MVKLNFIMGMPIHINIRGEKNEKIFEKVFDYFRWVDKVFSPYKANSEVTSINDGRIKLNKISDEMKLVLELSEKTKQETDGYFDIKINNYIDPSGLVKGWAINNAANLLRDMNFKSFYVNAGGDIQTNGLNEKKEKWAVGIKNPFKPSENVKIVYLSGQGIATSGTYEKGNHIYNPKLSDSNFKNSFLRSRQTSWPVASFSGNSHNNIVSLTVIGPNVYEADRFATAAFAMGIEGINFIERKKGLEGYMINSNGVATMTSGFEKYINA
jgi:FAD:protein FMN transferase